MIEELLGTVTDEPTLDRTGFDRLKTVRRGAFGLVVKDGLVAVVYAENEGHHELPGGGRDEGENAVQNFQREILEEVGYETTDITHLGTIREVWSAHGIETFSDFFIARAINEPHEVALTEKEIKRGITLKWLPFEALRKIILSEKPDTLMGRMKHGRDVVAFSALSKKEKALRHDIPVRDFRVSRQNFSHHRT